VPVLLRPDAYYQAIDQLESLAMYLPVKGSRDR